MAFLDGAPDRDRAEEALERIGRSSPGTVARRLFDAAAIDAHLDHLAAGQREDGGWTFNWLAWSPVAASEWRGSLTVDALRILSANDRL